MPSGRKMYVIIVGCGRLGAYIANSLSRSGHSVVVIDKAESAFIGLSVEFSGFQVKGDASEFAVLEQADPGRADVLIAATSHDNLNLMVAQVARRLLDIPCVMARVFDPEKERIYQGLGITTISPVSSAGEAFLQALVCSPRGAPRDAS